MLGLRAWAGLIGSITLELFGHLVNVVDDQETYFDAAGPAARPGRGAVERPPAARVDPVPTPDYILDLRRSYGHGRLLLPGVSAVVLRTDLGDPPEPHMLLTRRSDNGQWALPAGIVEPDEQPATTIVRELVEETRVGAEVDAAGVAHHGSRASAMPTATSASISR